MARVVFTARLSAEDGIPTGAIFRDENRGPMVHDHRDVGGTSPWMGEGRIMQEQLSRAMPGAIAEDVPSNRSRSGGILAEGSPQGRIGMGSEYHPGC
jgi:hypothetical protein